MNTDAYESSECSDVEYKSGAEEGEEDDAETILSKRKIRKIKRAAVRNDKNLLREKEHLQFKLRKKAEFKRRQIEEEDERKRLDQASQEEGKNFQQPSLSVPSPRNSHFITQLSMKLLKTSNTTFFHFLASCAHQTSDDGTNADGNCSRQLEDKIRRIKELEAIVAEKDSKTQRTDEEIEILKSQCSVSVNERRDMAVRVEESKAALIEGIETCRLIVSEASGVLASECAFDIEKEID